MILFGNNRSRQIRLFKKNNQHKHKHILRVCKYNAICIHFFHRTLAPSVENILPRNDWASLMPFGNLELMLNYNSTLDILMIVMACGLAQQIQN